MTHRTRGQACPSKDRVLAVGAAPELRLQHHKAIEQLNVETGEVVATFDSQSDAERQLKVSSGNISSVCHGKRDMAYGYFWRFKGSTKLPVPPKATHPKPVEQIERSTGKIIAIYSSQSEAERALNISAGNISSVCHGKRDSAYGYFWRFKGSTRQVAIPPPSAAGSARWNNMEASANIRNINTAANLLLAPAVVMGAGGAVPPCPPPALSDGGMAFLEFLKCAQDKQGALPPSSTKRKADFQLEPTGSLSASMAADGLAYTVPVPAGPGPVAGPSAALLSPAAAVAASSAVATSVLKIVRLDRSVTAPQPTATAE